MKYTEITLDKGIHDFMLFDLKKSFMSSSMLCGGSFGLYRWNTLETRVDKQTDFPINTVSDFFICIYYGYAYDYLHIFRDKTIWEKWEFI